MTYPELEAFIREKASQQQRGWQADLARRLEISSASVAQKLAGPSPRRIPPEHLHTYLDALGLEIVIQPKRDS